MIKKVFTSIIFCLFILLQFSCEKDVSVSPEEEKPVNGMLFLESNPSGAEIYLDGKNTGDLTPDTIYWLKERTYRVTLKKPLFKDTSIYLKVAANQITSRFLDYTTNPTMRGALYLETNPTNAEIFLGDSSTGLRTPATVRDLYPGEYKVSFKKNGCWTDTLNLTVESVRTKYFFITLTDTTDWIVFNKKRIDIPSESIRYIAIEKGWIKWIGTFGEGVIRYDDREFIHYTTQNSPLPSNIITSVHVDKLNRKWFCTDNGLAMFDDNTWTVYNTSNSALASNLVTSAAVDDNGVLWAGTYGYGLVKFDGIEWTLYTKENSKLPNNFINMVYIGPGNNKWIGTMGGGLVLINNYSQWGIYNVQNTIRPGIPPKPGFPNDNITCISVAPDGLKWVGFASLGGPGGSAYSRFSYWNRLLNLPSPEVLFLCTDKTNVIWFGTYDEGITRYQSGAWQNFDVSNSPMPSNIVYSIAVDNNNHKWIAALGGGLVKYKKN